MIVLGRVAAVLAFGAAAVLGWHLGTSGTHGKAPRSNGVAGHATSVILADARAAVLAAQSVHLVGTGTDHGVRTTFDLWIARNVATGTLTQGRQTVTVRRVGSLLFVRANAAAMHGKPGADTWLQMPITSRDARDLKQFTTLTGVRDLLHPSGAVRKGTSSIIDGTDAIGLIDVVHGKSDGTLYVATVGSPLPLRLVAPDGTIEFTDWNQPVDVSPPSGALQHT